MKESNSVSGETTVVSRHTVVLELPEPILGRKLAALNLLSGALDLVSPKEASALQNGASWSSGDKQRLVQGYAFDSPAAARTFWQQRQLEFAETYRQTPVQLLLAPTYACELACSYCYQRSYQQQGLMTPRQVDLALDAPVAAGRSKFVTIFGGEPLGPGRELRGIVKYILAAGANRGLETAIVTNGFRLAEWLDDLAGSKVKEIQVTLDGSREQHDSRRRTRAGEPTFDRIVHGIDLALAAGHTLNLRVVLDRANIDGLLDLTRLATEHGWLDLPAGRFKTQLGRNYELYDAYGCPADLFGLDTMYRTFVDLTETHPEIRRFHQPSFYGMREWLENGEMLIPRFDACPAAKHEWGFDMSGRVYGCTATLGQEGYSLGTYDPVWQLDAAAGDWQKRNIETIPGCQDCSQAPACGGGCGAIAHVQHGQVLAPDCKPVSAVMEQGLRFYFQALQKRIQEAKAS
ncbi:MAG: radical SAM protein [Candidatus Firestonebacteria bacterium]|nr:radical SAM protein [Candidatus Firestonebacteria bacterium]